MPDPVPGRRLKPLLLVAAALILACGLAATAVGAFLVLRGGQSATVAAGPSAAAPRATEAAPDAEADGETPDALSPENLPDDPPAIGDGEAPLTGRIVYVDAGLQVATINPDGSDARRLSDDGRVYQFPAWSPDSQRAAAIGSDRGGTGVFVFADEAAGRGTAVYPASSQAPIYFYWAPDSRRLSILANHPSGLGLHLAMVDEGGSARLLATGQPFYWAWSPIADEILIHTGASGEGATLAFLDPALAPGEAALGGNLAAPGSFQSPGISQSGDLWAFTEEDAAGARWLVVRQADGADRARLPHLGSLALSWSPQDERLAFISPGTGAAGLYGPLRLYDDVSGATRTLSAQVVVAFFWSPDGSKIAYLTVHGRNTIEAGRPPVGTELVGVSTRGGRALAQADELPLLDLWVVDVESGREGFLAAIQPTPLFVSQFLPFFDQYALSHRLWSPDSRALVLPARPEGNAQLLIVPVDGSPTRVLVDGTMGSWSTR